MAVQVFYPPPPYPSKELTLMSDSPSILDSQDRPLIIGQTVRHYVDGDIGTVTAVNAATSREPAHVVVHWTEETSPTGPRAHMGVELTIIDPPANPHPASVDQVGPTGPYGFTLYPGRSITVAVRPIGLPMGEERSAQDVIRRAFITGPADTMFSIPARVSIGGRKVAGFVTSETVNGYSTATPNDPEIYVFHPYSRAADEEDAPDVQTASEEENTSEDPCTAHGLEVCPDCGNGGVKMTAAGYVPCARFLTCWTDAQEG